MGKSFTPKYRIVIRAAQCYITPMEWKVRGRYGMRGYGAPTRDNLAAYVRCLEASCEPGCVNEHLGSLPILAATIVRQADNHVMARYERSRS